MTETGRERGGRARLGYLSRGPRVPSYATVFELTRLILAHFVRTCRGWPRWPWPRAATAVANFGCWSNDCVIIQMHRNSDVILWCRWQCRDRSTLFDDASMITSLADITDANWASACNSCHPCITCHNITAAGIFTRWPNYLCILPRMRVHSCFV